MPGGKAAVISAMLNLALSAGLDGWQSQDLLRQGLLAAAGGDCATALPALMGALTEKPNTLPAWKALASCEASAGHAQEATSAFRRITEMEPNSWQAWNNLGASYLESGGNDAAAQALVHSVRLNPRAVSALSNLAVALARLGRRSEAFQAIDQAEHASSGDPGIHTAWMSAAGAVATEAADQITAHRYAQACDQLKLVERALAGTASWQNLMGYTEFKLDRPKLALEHLQKALAMEPGNEDYLLDVAEFLAYYKADVHLLEVFKVAYGRTPDSPRVQYGLAVAYMLQNQGAEAAILLESLEAQHPDFQPAELALAECYEYLGKTDALFAFGERLRQVNPRNPNGWYFTGAAHLRMVREGHGSLPDAVAALQKSVDLGSKLPAAHFDLAKAYELSGKSDLAEAEFRQTLRLEPKHPSARYALGRLYQKEGKTELAARELSAHRELKVQDRNESYRRLVIVSRSE
jgi:tetratricopeptide (TPR) repeat protein